MRRRDLVAVEFLVDTDTRQAGDRLLVDPMSATSFCDRLKVAMRVGDVPTPPVVAVPSTVEEPAEDDEPAYAVGDDD